MLADLHCDTLYRCFTENKNLTDTSLHFSLSKANKILPCIQTFALYIPEKTENKLNFLKSILDNSFMLLENNPQILLFKNKSDIEKAEKQKKTLAVLSVEGGDLFTENRSRNRDIIKFLESSNIRFFSLCYNNGSKLCGGALCGDTRTASMTALDVCYTLNEHGIAVDVSHLNHVSTKTILDAGLKTVATHSNCFSLCPHPRNLTDENILKIIKNDGLIGINLYSPFLNKQHATLDDVLKHVKHIHSLGGSKNVALGTDFDGCDEFPDGISDVLDMSKLYNMLSDADSIFYNNVKHYLERM